MRESRLYGSVRGALSNERPYRDRFARNDVERAVPRVLRVILLQPRRSTMGKA